jgi:tetratricopeptide (TPR) repeat protein
MNGYAVIANLGRMIMISRPLTMLMRCLAPVFLAVTSISWNGCGGQPELELEDVAAHNRGVAYMGRFDFESAIAAFSKVAERYPANTDVQVNLGIATMNRQGEGDEEKAKAIFDRVLESEPSHTRAAYNSGLIELHQGDAEAAMPHFVQVTEADPNNAEAFYHVGQCHMQLQQFEEALPWFERAIEIDPYLRSAHYRAFQAAQRLRDRERAEAFIERFQALEANPRAHLVEFKYTRMGTWGEVMALGSSDETPIERPSGPIFAERRDLVEDAVDWRSAADPGPDLTVCDLDHDGGLDIFISGAIGDEGITRNAVLTPAASGFQLAPDHPLAAVDKVNTALWGDIDNDGLTDVYLCRRGPNQLWQQIEGGTWREITAATGTAGGDLESVDGALFDADHDGDLDIFVVNSNGANELFNNNRDGSFRPLAAEIGLEGFGAARALLVADLDADLDADLVILNRDARHEIYINELLWEYRVAEGWDEFVDAEIDAAVAGDVDADGRVEIYAADSMGSLSRWQEDQSGVWTAEIISAGPQESGPVRLALADTDGDGRLDLVTSTGSGWRVVSPTDGSELFAASSPAVTWSLASLEPSRGPSLVSFSPNDGPSVWPPGPGRMPFVAVTLTGKEDEADSMRTNASGIGTRLAARVGSRWTVVDTYRADSGPGQNLQPLLIGMRGAPRIDFVSIDWSDGVLQTEMDLEAGSIHTIAETQRQISSCPVLFSWDGETYVFVSDLLGVGGIGYALGFGEYGEPRPWERFMMPRHSLAPREGRLVLKLGEPMEEITYLDAARLVAYDLPPGWQMTVDERMSILGPEPTGNPIFMRQFASPVRAINERGEDVTGSVVEADLRAAPVGNLDLRFIGRLDSEYQLVLEFEEDLDRLSDHLVLVADGWVEYPYSQTNFAAWQAGADYRAPTLEARGADGEWKVLFEQFGYPAGMPRQMALPLPPLPRGTRALRLSTNQEVYWDRLVVAAAEQTSEIVRRQLRLAMARVEQPGFALRATGPQRLPSYDWARRAPLWDTRFQTGHYTRFGDALELVTATDDAVVIFGPGEAVHLEFEAPTEAPPPGWTRVYVFEADGWCKDMDRFTRDGSTVAPLPSAGRDPSIPDRLHEEYNTRYVTSSG